ncbi:ferric reductase like transmembrane component-domain-containing protein [Microdochium trichocladiopsis]|uniref:Ferric reductase like transmembrane component-domain-containing protein n=1 Tax=Microdochium trichocladiopsis TaxID=1682393 RepID=A0A9P8XUG0_9PEZI|nr:ferric reductase like transmembrane component-domain-containing protein [Microdochium trichocladiopsis]KAH7018337.1 ferric reductase like transmembrane component-domain-containing protein [Microdochium trichocladiopsis]
MAPWSYHFVELDAAQKHARRETIDHYAAIAHASTILPVLAGSVYRLFVWALALYRGRSLAAVRGSARGDYAAVPGSPALKHQTLSTAGGARATLRKLSWWLGDDVVLLGRRWGQRDQLIFGAAWTIWLVFLAFVNTGDDYLHLTKRLGIIAVSQFPLQYALSLKQLNPVAWAFNSSHERVNRIHRPLGRIVYLLLCVHAAMYLNFYYQTGILQAKMTSLVPVLGILSIAAMTLLMSTSLEYVRHLSYRAFFITHLLVALALPVAIFLHAHTARILVAEALLIFAADIGVRRLSTVEVDTNIIRVGDSDLLKLDMALPDEKQFARFAHDGPGVHVYLSVPQASRPSPWNMLAPRNLQFELMFNPFSIATTDDKTRTVTLVAKQCRGPMTRNLARLAAGEGDYHGNSQATVPLSIQGPFGCSRKFPDLAGPEFSSILLVAGGVGATFILPIYRSLASERIGPRVKMIWALRSAAQATWATTTIEGLVNDENCDLFLTGNILASSPMPHSQNGHAGEGSDIAMTRLSARTPTTTHISNGHQHINEKRPDLANIVDDVFKKVTPSQGRVAVLVCGPAAMARELRASVGVWVAKGRDVWWHDEGFSW